MEEVKRKRGRPRKHPIEEPKLEAPKVEEPVIVVPEPGPVKEEKSITSDWDIPLGATITFFDRNLSYELTGYKPINGTKGLDFKVSWFTEARETYKQTGHYCSYNSKTKAYKEFWKEEYRRCREGYTVNGYTITGDHYFFLNYYQLNNTADTVKAMSAITKDFPNFIVALYEYLHYLELCKRLRMNAVLVKARALGFSELNAAITANFYSTCKNSTGIVVASEEKKLTPTLNKLWEELSFLNYHTDGGFFKLRQVVDKALHKKASRYEVINGQKAEVGFGSLLIGIVADSPDKVRGYRCGLLVFEEAGSFPNLLKSVIQGEALLDVGGNKIGISLIGGTGGDSNGKSLEGLRNIYYNPDDFGVLPYRHNYTVTGEQVLTGYFLPSYSVILKPGFLDERGYTDPAIAKAYWQALRDKLVNNPSAYIDHCAERCFVADEAFALEGTNKFNKLEIASQLAQIRLLHLPKVENGNISYIYKDSVHSRDNISGFKWTPDIQGKVHIVEHPLWIDNENMKLMKDLYVAGIDAIDLGLNDTSDATKDPSKFCIVIKRRAYGMSEPQYVAYYKDRPADIRTAFKTAICLAKYYNCKINIEASKISMLNYAKITGDLGLFMKRPRATLADLKSGKSNTYGTPATPAIIDHQTDLIANFVEDYCYTIWFDEFLDELNRYTDDAKRKFDIVASLGMCELADEELSGVVPTSTVVLKLEFSDYGYYIDENGYKRKGIIPKQVQQLNTIISNDYGGIRSSDPRNYS